MGVNKAKAEIPTIDCSLVTIQVGNDEFGFDTANQIAVEPQIEEEDAVKLVVKGILRAQKPATRTITGNQITLTDNVFNPELVLVLQGGTIIYDSVDPTKIIGYQPPVAGSGDKGEKFTLNAYSAQYNAAGQIVNYEKIAYPNCQGQPVAFGAEDGAFRAPEYTIDSAPNTGEAPYTISYVDELPELIPAGTVSVKQNLTHCTSSFSGVTTARGEAFTATITADDTYTLGTVTVTMGGVDISATAVTGGTISIAEVTGDLIITAEASA
jgi:hypothetical protein